MDGDERIRRRSALWLRAERAMGAGGVAIKRRPMVREQVTPAPAQTALAPARIVVAAPAAKPQPVVVAANPLPLLDTSRGPFTSPVLSRDDKIAALAELDARSVKPCRLCRLCETRTNTVFGEGDPDAKIFFIGEGPGENEDLQGRPFVGRAGELLNKMIAGMGLRREDVFIANIVKCRPPNNRVPAPDEVETCTPYLVRQLEVVRPQVIVTLGLPAAKYMLETRSTMGQMRGQWHSWRGIKLMPTYHPAFLLRSYTQENRAAVWSDLQKVMAEVGLPPRGKPA